MGEGEDQSVLLLCHEDTCNFACTWVVVLSVLNLWVFCRCIILHVCTACSM